LAADVIVIENLGSLVVKVVLGGPVGAMEVAPSVAMATSKNGADTASVAKIEISSVFALIAVYNSFTSCAGL
jgi:hypothetical protein